MRLLARIFVVLFLVFLAASAGAVLLFYKEWHGRGPLASDATVVIEPGSHTTTIARQLQDAGVVEDWRLFVIGVKLFADHRPLRAGEYRFGAGMSQEQVMRMLISGATYARRVTIPEGYTIAQVLKLVSAAEGLVGDLPPDPPAEGHVLPETYFYTRGESRYVMVNRMAEAMQQALAKLWPERAADLPFDTPEKALVLASLVEKETVQPMERAHVAGVFINRLRRGMPLQSDPTVIYAVTGGQGPLGREISAADLQIKSPYNTYLVKGLPPAPICNPGLAAIQAVLHPMATKDIYFVADGSGGHAFAQTLAEHNRNVAAYRKLLAQQAAEQAVEAEAAAAAAATAADPAAAEAPASGQPAGGGSGESVPRATTRASGSSPAAAESRQSASSAAGATP